MNWKEKIANAGGYYALSAYKLSRKLANGLISEESFERGVKEERENFTKDVEGVIKQSQQQLLDKVTSLLEKKYGKDGGDALVIISTDDEKPTQRPALSEVKALIQEEKAKL